jgi:predicted Rossmann fold flavoprotein
MSVPRQEFDVVIVGAGAAGLMCAMTAGRRGRRVLLLDHADKVGAKILISGGGRCNFTNLGAGPGNFISANPHFCRSALERYTQADFIALVNRHGISFHEKTLGQLFCDGSARNIVAMLMAECSAAGVDVRTGCQVSDISRSDVFHVATNAGSFSAKSLVLATGGLSIPKMGATGFAYDVAKRFGLGVTETVPGLVPLTADAAAIGFPDQLAGLSLPAVTGCGKRRFAESILFTHRGLSGPAILQISSYWRQGQTIELDLLPGLDAAAALLQRKRDRAKTETKGALAELLPARLAQAVALAHLPPGQMSNVPDRVLSDLGARLRKWTIRPTGSEGYAKAEVTVGGIDTRHVSSKTMEARNVPGLFAIGEAVDVTGWLGGYNFQWAWSSGWCAGQAV